MDNKKKGIRIFIAAIMIASIFAVIAPTGVGTEALVENPALEKLTEYPEYEIGKLINYTMTVCNPETEYSMTLNVTDLPSDQYPGGTPLILDLGLVLEPGECKTYNETTNPETQYVVDADDIIGGYVWNVFKAEGKNNKTVPEVVKSEAELNTKIIVPTPTPTPTPSPPAVPALTPFGIAALIGLLSIVAAMSISIKRRRGKE